MLQLIEVLVRVLEQTCQIINFTQFIFLKFWEILQPTIIYDMGVGDFVIHNGVEIIDKRPQDYYGTSMTATIIKVLRVNFFIPYSNPGICWEVERFQRHIIRVILPFMKTQASIDVSSYPTVISLAPILVYPMVSTYLAKRIIEIRGIMMDSPTSSWYTLCL